MTGDHADDGVRPLPADAVPGPVLEYRIDDSVPVVAGVDGRFRSEFGDLPPGVPVAEGFDRCGLAPEDGDVDVGTRLVRGDGFALRIDDGGVRSPRRYRAAVTPDSGASAGHVVIVDDDGSVSGDDAGLGVDHVASVVSHDLRNPLEVAKTRLRAGRETGEDEHFDHVARAHERMEQIIEDVLTLARGEDTIDPSEEVDLTDVARTAWESVDSDGATLAVDARLPTAVVDPDRTGRVFENLFRNAVEHGSTSPRSQAREDAVEHGSTSPRSHAPGDAVEHGSTSPRSHAREDGPSPQVRVGPIDSGSARGFYVADDGPGIPASERDAVFEPGYSTHDQGTGLGLAIVERIADAHGWSLDVTASEDGGARIEVRGLSR